MAIPDLAALRYYLGENASWTDDEISQALLGEMAAQARNCRIPDIYPDDLAEALKRRVAHNLALRALPLGVQATISDYAASTTRVGGEDAEVRRLERPYRKLIVG
ncbi:hypothetical protein [Nocardioides nematodiphilus]|uniref:hypothetical protein n=1 Tax=Nocardioides nematodiphilus TaxID=2849669 RepID=UPI001CDA1E8A|nr:hypothetical protein [Nocardioides nematodiphilus]MCA1984798.1 hypothetical protein [Nocardioides nematodiphilus]